MELRNFANKAIIVAGISIASLLASSIALADIVDRNEAPLPFEELPIARALKGESVDELRLLLRNRRHPKGLPMWASARPIFSCSTRFSFRRSFRNAAVPRNSSPRLRT